MSLFRSRSRSSSPSPFRPSNSNNPMHTRMAELMLESGAWLILPSYMIYVMGSEILQGLTIAGGGAVAAADDGTSLIKTE